MLAQDLGAGRAWQGRDRCGRPGRSRRLRRANEPGGYEIRDRRCGRPVVQWTELRRRYAVDGDDDPFARHRASNDADGRVTELANPDALHAVSVARVLRV